MKPIDSHKEQLLADVLAGTLRPEDAAIVDGLRATDPAFAEAYDTLQDTLALTATRQRPMPPDDYWDSYYDRLQDRLHASDGAPASVPSPRPDWAARLLLLADALLTPQRARQLAFAMVLVVSGVLIGRFSADQAPNTLAEGPGLETPALVHEAALSARTQAYLNRSHMLLIGLVNTEATPATSANLPYQQQMADELVHQATVLKADLGAAEEHRLQKLVHDLEVILLQIANLEAGSDQPAIELIRQGVDHQGLFLKINLEKMRQATPAASSTPTPSQHAPAPRPDA